MLNDRQVSAVFLLVLDAGVSGWMVLSGLVYGDEPYCSIYCVMLWSAVLALPLLAIGVAKQREWARRTAMVAVLVLAVVMAIAVWGDWQSWRTLVARGLVTDTYGLNAMALVFAAGQLGLRLVFTTAHLLALRSAASSRKATYA